MWETQSVKGKGKGMGKKRKGGDERVIREGR